MFDKVLTSGQKFGQIFRKSTNATQFRSEEEVEATKARHPNQVCSSTSTISPCMFHAELTKSLNYLVKTCFEVTFCSQTTRAGRLPPDCPILECSRSLSCLFTIALKLDPPDGCQLTVKHQDLDFPGCWRGGSDKSFGNLTNLNTVLAKIMVLLILIMIILRDRKVLKFGFHPNCPGGAPSFRKNHLGFSRQARTMPWTEKLHS